MLPRQSGHAHRPGPVRRMSPERGSRSPVPGEGLPPIIGRPRPYPTTDAPMPTLALKPALYTLDPEEPTKRAP